MAQAKDKTIIEIYLDSNMERRVEIVEEVISFVTGTRAVTGEELLRLATGGFVGLSKSEKSLFRRLLNVELERLEPLPTR